MTKTLTTQEKVVKKLASYSALAGAFILVNANANAQAVVYTDVNPDETYDNDGEFYELDLNGDGAIDFMFKINDFTYPGFFYSIADPTNTWAGLIENVRIYSYNGSVGGSSGASGTLLPYALNAGIDIDNGMQFNTSSSYGNQILGFYLGVIDYPAVGSTYAFVEAGNWPGKNEKFVALKLNDGGNDYYGWARLSVGSSSNEFTIHDYAYNSTADGSIESGQTAGVAVHNVIQNNQVSAYGYGNSINITVNQLNTTGATVKVFDMEGKVIYQNDLNLSGMQITLDNAASGNYTLQIVTAENAVFSKTVNIQQ